MKKSNTDKADAYFLRGLECEEAGDIDRALKYYRKASRLGVPQAQCSLGTLYDDVIKPDNPQKAVYWYKRAVKNGDSMAAYNLAIHYRNLSKPKWHKFWMRKAAAMGDEDAKSEIKNL
ncbi:MAG: hypothetical protein DHS20C05_09000 [Hyphococcus sp.]|nr:MAG: hypothetical protein DHS20C05_09000 [Marinicaulis sp.]